MADESKAKNTELNDTLAKVQKLQDRLYKACGKLDENMQFTGKQLYEEMLNNYYKQYLREYELINAQELIDVDKEIEKLKIERMQELETIAAEKAAIDNEFKMLRITRQNEFELEKAKFEEEFRIERDKELGEIQLRHEKLKTDIIMRKLKLEEESQILLDTVEQELQITAERVTPAAKRRFRLLGLIPIGRVKYNQAMNLALDAAEISEAEYLMSRSKEIADRQAQYMERYYPNEEPEEATEEGSEAEEAQEEAEPVQIIKREQKKLLKRLKKLDIDKQAGIAAQLSELIAAAEELDVEPGFVPEPLDEKERQKLLKDIEKQKRREQKEEKKRMKKKNKKKAEESSEEEPDAEQPAEAEEVQPTEEAEVESE